MTYAIASTLISIALTAAFLAKGNMIKTGPLLMAEIITCLVIYFLIWPLEICLQILKLGK